MNCNERQDLMLPYAAELLDEAQQAEIRAHLESGCTACDAALVEAQKLLEQIPASVDPVAAPPDAIKKLMQRVRSEQAMAGSSRRIGFRWVAIAACLGLLIGHVATHYYDESVGRMSDMSEVLSSKQLQLIPIAAGDQSGATGRVLWDKDHGYWHVQVFNLKPPGAGKTYELWFIKPDDTKVRAGIFDTDAKGSGRLSVKVPDGIGPLKLAAITEEPAGGVEQPTSPPRLYGNVQ
jgi:anti-sigma-K factor RskA